MAKKVKLTKQFVMVTEELKDEMIIFNKNLEVVMTGKRCLSASKNARKALSNIRKLAVEWRKMSPKKYE